MLTNPEHGIKGYVYPNPCLEEGIFEIPKIAKQKEDKYKAGFLNHHLKLHSFVPPARDVPFLHPWGKDPYYKTSCEIKRGKLNKDPKITYTEKLMRNEKRKGYPAAKYNIPSEFDIPVMKEPIGDKQEKFLSFVEDEIARA